MKQERLMQVLISPHLSEKSTRAAEEGNQHVFRVVADATKPEVRQAVEQLFSVKVAAVQIVNVKGKRKRFGARAGKRSDWKKAYVRLAAGDDINFSGMV